MFGFMWTSSIKWIFRLKPNQMFSTKRTVNKGIDKYSRSFEPKPKLNWIKGGFFTYLVFIMLAIIGSSIILFYYFNKSEEMIERSELIKENNSKTNQEYVEYLVNNAEYEFVNSHFITAKKELDLALDIDPNSIEANRLYIQTMIQLVEQYPAYQEKAITLSKHRLRYLSKSKNDQILLETYQLIVLSSHK